MIGEENKQALHTRWRKSQGRRTASFRLCILLRKS